MASARNDLKVCITLVGGGDQPSEGGNGLILSTRTSTPLGLRQTRRKECGSWRTATWDRTTARPGARRQRASTSAAASFTPTTCSSRGTSWRASRSRYGDGTNKHLPAFRHASWTKRGRDRQVGGQQRGMLEELEKAHIYISQLSTEIKSKDAVITSMQARLDELAKRLARLESVLPRTPKDVILMGCSIGWPVRPVAAKLGRAARARTPDRPSGSP